MAGVLLHLAMGDPEKMDPVNSAYSASYKKAYILGLLLPDIAKRGFIDSEEDFSRFFEGCSGGDILTYEEYLEFRKNNHFNPNKQNPSQQDTRNPNLIDFMNADFVDLHKPVWQGVLCHLMGDKAFYYKSYCVNFERLSEDYIREVGAIEVWDENRWGSSETSKVHYNDYNLLNRRIEDQYGVLDRVREILSPSLLSELLTDFHVRFPDDSSEPVYMNLENIRKCIEYLHRVDKKIGEGNGGAIGSFREDAVGYTEPGSTSESVTE